MKRIIILILLFFGVLTLPSRAQTFGWVDMSTHIPDFSGDTVYIGNDTLFASFTDVFFVNDNEGWISVISNPPIILHTTNGGLNWSVQPIGSYCENIWMVDALNGYAGGDDGMLWKTNDGGNTWILHGFTGSTTITGISFPPGSDTGYVCSDNNINICQIQPSGITYLPIASVNFWSDISAVAVGDFFYCGGIHMYHYSNQQLTQPYGDICDYFHALSFTDPDHGFIVNECQVQGYRTGLTYLHKIAEFVPNLHHLRDVFALDSNYVWVVGIDGFIMSSSNASDFGLNSMGNYYMNVVWDSTYAGITQNDLLNVYFTSQYNGYAVGNNNTLLKYTQISGIEENETPSGIKIYPNPSDGNFHVNIASATNSTAEIKIVNFLGQIILKTSIKLRPGNNSLIFNSKIDPGIYLLWLSDTQNKLVKKIIIE